MVINKFWWQIDSFHMVAEWQCAWKQSRSRVLQHQHARQVRVIFTRVLYKNYTCELVYTQMSFVIHREFFSQMRSECDKKKMWNWSFTHAVKMKSSIH